MNFRAKLLIMAAGVGIAALFTFMWRNEHKARLAAQEEMISGKTKLQEQAVEIEELRRNKAMSAMTQKFLEANSEIEKLRHEHNELLRLRGEVALLRTSVSELKHERMLQPLGSIVPIASSDSSPSARKDLLGVIQPEVALEGVSREPALGSSYEMVVYVVTSGDTMNKIAKQFNCSAKDLRRLNRLNNSVVRVGEQLRVAVRKLE